MDHISIIVVHYNTLVETKACLESLLKIRKSTHFSTQIILVDNASKKKFLIPKSLKNSKIHLIRSEANLGFTGGYNLGLSHAVKDYNSDYFLLLNSDTEVEADFLEILYQKIKEDPKIGLVSPKIYFYKNNEFYKKSYSRNQKGRVIWYAGGSIDWPNLNTFHRNVDEIDRGQCKSNHEIDFVTGCCVLIRRECLETVGILDKKYFLYFEDVDYSLRMKKHGYKLSFASEAVIYHKNAISSGGSGSPMQSYYQTRNQFLVAFRYGPKKYFHLYCKLLFINLLSKDKYRRRAVIDWILGRFGKQNIL